MKLGMTYLCVKDINRSLAFYKQILNKEPTFMNENRWIQFDYGNSFALYNAEYDKEIIANEQKANHFNEEYLDAFELDNKKKRLNTMVVFNFYCDDIHTEYKRIKDLGIEVSALKYVNIFKPYWYFTIYDPDGNEIEITDKRKTG